MRILKLFYKYITATIVATQLTGFGAALAESPEATRANQQLAAYRELPTFEAPGEAFDAAACMKGKSILSIPASSGVPFVKTIGDSMSKVAKTIGFDLKIWENQGQPTQWVQGFDYAINNKYDMIDLLAGADPRFLAPQVKAANAAGIKVVASHLTGFEQILPEGVSGVPIDYKRAGALLADWAIWKTDGKANALVIGINDVLSTESMMSGIEEEFSKCPNCNFVYKNVSIPDLATRTGSIVQGALAADPTLNYIIPIYDVMNLWVVPAITIAGRSDQVKVATFNGTPFALKMIQDGKIEMDVGENLDWIAHGIIDSEMRMLCDLPEVSDAKIPLLIFDQNNADTAGNPPEVSTGYGDAYIDGYRKLWKLE
jgi:ribose transport system substrate-binding protein